MPAFTINIPIRVADAEDVKNAFAESYGYTQSIQVAGVTVPNPISKEEFVKQKCINFMLEITRSYLIKQEEIIAKQAVESAVKLRSDEVVGWFDNRRLESLGGIAVYQNFPTANDISITTNKNEAVNFVLTGTDPDNLALTFLITQNPEHGIVVGTSPNFSYVPNNRYFGSDTFKFKASNSSKIGLEATATITINRTLTAVDAYYTIRKNQNLDFTLTAHDGSGNINFSLIDLPSNGNLNGNNPFTYTPALDFVGIDTLTFEAQDDTLTSNVGTITIDVTNLVIAPQNYDVIENTNLIFNPVTYNAVGIPDFEIVTNPTNGSLVKNDAEFTYIPNSNFVGMDSFEIKAIDSYGESTPGLYNINVIQQ
jgi:hypothetical protein